MTIHNKLINKITSTYQSDQNNNALLVTCSVARDEQTETSDLDLILITQEKKQFREENIEGIVVETKINTLENFIQKIHDNPMNVCQWLDAKVIFDKNNSAESVINEAKSIYKNYKPDPKEITNVKKWLESAKSKIESAQNNKDELALGFNVSNILWQIVTGLYLINNKPLPPSTTAFKRIKDLENLPNNFDINWKKLLTGDLSQRSEATLDIIAFLIKSL